jgi:hypothetical protein
MSPVGRSSLPLTSRCRVEAGPVPRADLQGLCDIITERLKRLCRYLDNNALGITRRGRR